MKVMLCNNSFNKFSSKNHLLKDEKNTIPPEAIQWLDHSITEEIVRLEDETSEP